MSKQGTSLVIAQRDANGDFTGLIDDNGRALPVGGGNGTSYTLPKAAAGVLGGVKVGSNLSVAADGTLSAPNPPAAYSLPAATTAALGGVKAGTGLDIAADGTLSTKNPLVVVASAAPSNADGRPDGTIYFQTA